MRSFWNDGLRMRRGMVSILIVLSLLVISLGCDSDDGVGPQIVNSSFDIIDLSLMVDTVSVNVNHYAVDFVDTSHGWIVGDAGVIFATTDGGMSWTLQKQPDNNWFFDIDFSDTSNGCCVGMSFFNPYNPLALVTSDGGTTWTEAGLNIPDSLMGPLQFTCVDIVASDFGMIGGGPWPEGGANFMVLTTEDAGASWTDTYDSTQWSWPVIEDLVYFDDSNFCLVGNRGLISGKNAGEWFEHDTSSTPNSKFCGVSFADPTTGWVVGSADKTGTVIMNTVDGGLTWTRQNVADSYNLTSVHFFTSAIGWAVGDDGVCLYTSNGGQSWSSVVTGTSLDLLDVVATGSEEIWIVGEDGLILHSVSATQ